jgi:hypothetical protein
MAVLFVAGEGERLRTDRDAVEVIGQAFEARAEVVAIPIERLDADFFRLRSGVAGAFAQKFVQYRRRLVLVGDIARYEAESAAFAAWVTECNRGEEIWFVRDRAELEERLAERASES